MTKSVPKADLQHFAAENHGGTEFVSACLKHVEALKRAKAVWSPVPPTSCFAHTHCDLCEFENGKLPYRLADLLTNGLLPKDFMRHDIPVGIDVPEQEIPEDTEPFIPPEMVKTSDGKAFILKCECGHLFNKHNGGGGCTSCSCKKWRPIPPKREGK